jgi:hypothetical protein
MKPLREIVEGFFLACTAPMGWTWALHGFGGGMKGYPHELQSDKVRETRMIAGVKGPALRGNHMGAWSRRR